MKSLLLFVLCLLGTVCFSQTAKNTITLSGRATDFEGHPIDSCIIELKHSDFSPAYTTYTDKNGYYRLEHVEKGNYMALYAIRPKEYPREDAVPDEDKRLEFWAWNVIADRDLTINPRYHRLELYGTNVFRIEGGYPGLMIYVRPMSVSKILSYSKEIVLNKSKAEKMADISVKPEHFEVKVFADEEPLKVNSVQPLEEFEGEGNVTIMGYLIQVDVPKKQTDKPYFIFRIEATNTEHGEKGENWYFYEPKEYK